ncbi:MAG: DUF4402 domain-containing protein [Bacteroidales bacterium]|jgi:hypothetical protein
MNASIKLFTLAAILMGFGVRVQAQSIAFATTTVDLITPIAITKTAEMHFGTVAASGTPGTIILAYNSTTTVGTGGATIVTTGSSEPSTAKFLVTGLTGETFSIGLPTDDLVLTGTTDGMKAGTFRASTDGTNDVNTGTIAEGGTTISIKAILTVPANAVAGRYANANQLIVKVNYN